MLKISESLFDVPIAGQSRPENVKKLTDLILKHYHAQNLQIGTEGTGALEEVPAAAPNAHNQAGNTK